MRVKIDNCVSINDLYSWVSEFYCCFFVFNIDGMETRYSIPKINSEEEFLKWINKTKVSIATYGVDSDYFDISKAEYIDMYFRYPNK